MPLWHVYHSPGTYTEHDKRDFAADVTQYYARFGLPEFYVVVLFHEVAESAYFVGGRPSGRAVRIAIEHLARHVDSPEMRWRMTESLDKVMAPHTRDRGLYCEFHVDETPRDLWMIAGLRPPDTGSEAEKAWVEANEPIPY